MFRSWGHGHSTLLGIGVGVLLDNRVAILCIICTALGFFVGRVSRFLGELGRRGWRVVR